MAISVVSSTLSWCSTGGPGAQLSAGCWLSLQHLVTNESPKLTGGPEGPCGRVWLSLPHLVSNSSFLQLADFLFSPSYIIVQSPTQSLEWPVWSSSSGNNCHTVQRSFSSGASVNEYIMGFYLVPFRQPIRLRHFFRLLDIGMCNFLPVHHFGNGLFGRVEGQHITTFHSNIFQMPPYIGDSVSCGCRIHRLHLCRGVRIPNIVLDMILTSWW